MEREENSEEVTEVAVMAVVLEKVERMEVVWVVALLAVKQDYIYTGVLHCTAHSCPCSSESFRFGPSKSILVVHSLDYHRSCPLHQPCCLLRFGLNLEIQQQYCTLQE